jgi:uncharacterized membrane protein YbaN (DUF454 family)
MNRPRIARVTGELQKLGLRRVIYLGIGWLSVGMVIMGVILPILPTTPMLLVAVWAFGRSSPELAERIRAHRVFGPPIRDWQDNGVISLKAKALALGIMMLMGGWLWAYGGLPIWLLVVVTGILAGAAIYVASRPSFNT